MILIWSLIFIFIIAVSLWNVFTKAGRRGWKAFIPVYNGYIVSEIAGRPGWIGLLLYSPFVLNFVSASEAVIYAINIAVLLIYLILSFDLAKAFKKGPLFGFFGLFLFSFVGFMILGWGNATYRKPVHN